MAKNYLLTLNDNIIRHKAYKELVKTRRLAKTINKLLLEHLQEMRT